jgi:2,4-dienoyl-CoA reductase-like NADH-dependent reductase (Old Yellow Enzyme family)
MESTDPIFEPLKFRSLTVKNRLTRSSITGRIDNYDGSGTQARINWETKFARGGVGMIMSAHIPIHIGGRIIPNVATIDSDATIPFWRRVGAAVHRHGCAYVAQLSHSGRQQDLGGLENEGIVPLSSSNRRDGIHGLPGRAMTKDEIKWMVGLFAAGARRAQEAGLDGIELHGSSGYLITTFLSSAINDRRDEYGGGLENRARFLMEVIDAVRTEVGRGFHMQLKISAVDKHNAVNFWERPGNTLEDSVQVCRWAEAAGVDAIHASVGSTFPHPWNSAGPFPMDAAARHYPVMVPSGTLGFRNYLLFRYRVLRPIFRALWDRTRGERAIEGINLPESRAIKQVVNIPVICTGGFQTAAAIRAALVRADCDAVSMARTLIANPDLPQIFARGRDTAERPCTYCNKCMVAVLSGPLGCYELSRYDGDRERMTKEAFAFLGESPEEEIRS